MSKISELSDGGSLVSSDYLIAVRSGGNVKVRMDQINVDQIDLGDNEFIRLGNSQDLTIVHDASNSIINQAGIGDLLIQKAGTTKASVTANGLEFPDSSKAIFGAGSDLQIYHDGSHSYVSDQGTGNLRILAQNFTVRNPANNESMIIATPDAGVTLYYDNAGKLATTATGIDVTGTADVSSQVLVGNSDSIIAENNIRFKSSGGAFIDHNTTGQSITFRTSNASSLDTTAVTIDSSGNLLVGTTTTTAGNEGMVYFNGSSLRVTRDSDEPLNLDRLTTDGTIAAFKKDGTTVGSIGAVSGDIVVGTGDTGLRFYDAGRAIQPRHTDGTAANDVISLGMSTNRFKDLYLSGGVNAAQVNLADAGGTLRNVLDLDGSDNLKVGTGSSAGTRAITFFTENTEQMRLDASGNLLVGTTSVINTGVVSVEFTGASQNGISIKTTTASNGSKFLSFADSAGTEIGYIEENTSTSVNYSTSSDQRLKDNIVDAPSASDDIDAIQVRSFDWKSNGSHQKYGMVAQELQTVAPEAVSGDADSEEMMGVDYSKLVPMMLKEIQSLRARVAQLES